MHIRKAQAQDFLAIAQLDRSAWTQNRESKYIPDGEHVWRIWMDYACCYCAVIDQQIVGVIMAFPCHIDAHSYPNLVDVDSGRSLFCVHKVMVDAKHRGKGIGGELFKSLLSTLDGLQASSFLTVEPVNTSAMALYRKWGYQLSQRVDGFYRDNEDRCILVRSPQSTVNGPNENR